MSRAAFYIGTSSAEVYRLALAALHFTVVVYLMWAPPMSFGWLYLVLFVSFICVDSQALMLGMFLDQATAPLLATVAGVFMALLNGFPNVPFVNPASYAFWATEAVATLMAEPYALYDVTVTYDIWFYTLGRYGADIGIMLAMAAVYRAGAFALLVLRNRDQQC